MVESKKEISKMLRIARGSWIIIIMLLLTGNAMAVEEAKYKVLREENGFELREYESHILAETLVDGEFEDAGSEAFGRLFKYISGNNKQQQKVAMTSPVGQEPTSQKIEMTSPVGQQKQDGKWIVSFMMPASFTLETTPEPKDPNISIREVPARLIASVRYSGFWSEKSYHRNLAKLQDWIANNRLTKLGEPIWARYNPPFMPWFLRRNEILIPVASPESDD
ncbi:heme-binding protein [Oceanimonas sp. CHS3-5]|uniref:SOUL family heme-binding protein n=1 Tax=Oceanimonas sp. CHS3-5 TaxID=3068186 RepID=UPI00273D3C70|nr:heme-binding protein [Oceanimonas sp. CHS3-5]MDP5291997.1 heme-binding protein [Oceanimonas sp. CHS3-5]